MHRGHLADEVTFLLIGEKEGFFFSFLVKERSLKAGGGFQKGSVPERKLVRKLKRSEIFVRLHVADTNGEPGKARL